MSRGVRAGAAAVVAALATTALTACGADVATPTREAALVDRLARITGLRLERVKIDPDTRGMWNVRATYSGGRAGDTALLVIFDSPSATRQVIGRPRASPAGTSALAERNVTVLLSGPVARRGLDRQIRDAIRAETRAG